MLRVVLAESTAAATSPHLNIDKLENGIVSVANDIVSVANDIVSVGNDIVSVANDIVSVEYAIQCIQRRIFDNSFQVIDAHLLYLNKLSNANLNKELSGLRQKEAGLRQKEAGLLQKEVTLRQKEVTLLQIVSDLRKEKCALTERLPRSQLSPQRSVSFPPTNEIEPVMASTTIGSSK